MPWEIRFNVGLKMYKSFNSKAVLTGNNVACLHSSKFTINKLNKTQKAPDILKTQIPPCKEMLQLICIRCMQTLQCILYQIQFFLEKLSSLMAQS